MPHFAEKRRTESAAEVAQLGILPCPFCGEQPVTSRSGDGGGLVIECVTDSCVRPHCSFYDPQMAVTRWNTRASEQSV